MEGAAADVPTGASADVPTGAAADELAGAAADVPTGASADVPTGASADVLAGAGLIEKFAAVQLAKLNGLDAESISWTECHKKKLWKSLYEPIDGRDGSML